MWIWFHYYIFEVLEAMEDLALDEDEMEVAAGGEQVDVGV